MKKQPNTLSPTAQKAVEKEITDLSFEFVEMTFDIMLSNKTRKTFPVFKIAMKLQKIIDKERKRVEIETKQALLGMESLKQEEIPPNYEHPYWENDCSIVVLKNEVRQAIRAEIEDLFRD